MVDTDDTRRTMTEGRRTTAQLWHKLPTGELKMGGHTYEGVERLSWGGCGEGAERQSWGGCGRVSPLTQCGNFSFSRTLKCPLTHTKGQGSAA